MVIAFFDWREPERNSGVAVSFTGKEEDCSCYNAGNPCNPFDWDVSIKMLKLSESEQHELRVKLALAWQFMQPLQQYAK